MIKIYVTNTNNLLKLINYLLLLLYQKFIYTIMQIIVTNYLGNYLINNLYFIVRINIFAHLVNKILHYLLII